MRPIAVLVWGPDAAAKGRTAEDGTAEDGTADISKKGGRYGGNT